MFIIIPSIYGLFKKEWVSSLLGLIIGVLLLLACQDVIDWSMVGKSFIPLLLIIIGVLFVIKPKLKNVPINEKGLPEYIGVFSDNVDKVTGKFNGAELVSVFGGVELDLTKASIKKDIVIDCVSVFGGIDLKVPGNVVVKSSGVPIFGGIENKAAEDGEFTILINYVCIFGGIDIK